MCISRLLLPFIILLTALALSLPAASPAAAPCSQCATKTELSAVKTEVSTLRSEFNAFKAAINERVTGSNARITSIEEFDSSVAAFESATNARLQKLEASEFPPPTEEPAPASANCSVTTYEGSGFITFLREARPNGAYTVVVGQSGEANYATASRTTDAAGGASYEGQWAFNGNPITITWQHGSDPAIKCQGPEPPKDTTPPDTTITGGPSGITTATTASFTFTATESGSTFQCSLDALPYAACTSPRSYTGIASGQHTFSVKATDAAGNTDQSPATRAWTVEAEEPPAEEPPNTGACEAGSTVATTATAVRNAVSAGQDVKVTAGVGNVNLENLGQKAGVVVCTAEGGSMGFVNLKDTQGLTVQSARLRSIELRNSSNAAVLGSVLGGTQANRTLDQVIFAPETSNNLRIENNDIGWTVADNSGNTGYGCRCYGTLNNLRFVGNKLHDLAADGFQGVGGENVLIDRNEIGPVGANPASSEHTDNIQITYNGPNLRITNNWIHHQGFYEGQVVANAGATYIHGGSNGALTYENNFVQIAQGRVEFCGLGTGGTDRSNVTIRRNTFYDLGRAFTGFPGFEWDCDSGSNDLITRNVAVDPDGGLAQDGFASAIVAPNIWGQLSAVTLDAQGNCTSANCNPADGPIGYRKPSGVSW